MIAKSHPISWIAALLIVGTSTSRAACTPGSPTGHFQGTATSKEAGKLEISLDLRCVNQQYQGELVTPVGTYTVSSGSDTDGELQLQLVAGTETVSVNAQFKEQTLQGQFTSGNDSGPVEMRRTGDVISPGSAEPSLDLTKEQWNEDIDFFARELPQRHANAFHHTTRQQFDAAIADLKRRLAGMNGDEIYVALDRIANSIGDAHTYVEFPADMAEFPLRLAKFGSDYRVVAVGAGFEAALGARVTEIGNTPIGRVHDIAVAITPAAETTALADARVTGFLTMGIVLHGFGIIPDRNVASYTLLDDGRKRTLGFRVVPRDGQINWVDLIKRAPLRDQNPDQDFWYVYLPDSRTIYCAFRGYQRLDQNASGLLREIHDKDPDKLVIDLRQNHGGDFSQGLKYLIDPVAGISKLNRRGHLFVLIGTSTFSAAMSNAAQFRQRTAALLVGEPIGERPNSYQEAREMRLPNSRLKVRYSTQYYEFVKGTENIIRPDREIAISWEDYKAGWDPVIQWALQDK